jgi:hypothetical protein
VGLGYLWLKFVTYQSRNSGGELIFPGIGSTNGTD